MIIGICGYKGSGKDTFAQCIVSEWPAWAQRVAFADKLKDVCMDLFDLTREQVHGSQSEKETIDPRWELSPRQILQRFGTEVGRSVHPDVWIRATMREIDSAQSKLWLVTDVRFENEAAAIRERGGVIVQITRPGCEPDGHASESLNFQPDVIISNDGSLGRLHLMATSLARPLILSLAQD